MTLLPPPNGPNGPSGSPPDHDKGPGPGIFGKIPVPSVGNKKENE